MCSDAVLSCSRLKSIHVYFKSTSEALCHSVQVKSNSEEACYQYKMQLKQYYSCAGLKCQHLAVLMSQPEVSVLA